MCSVHTGNMCACLPIQDPGLTRVPAGSRDSRQTCGEPWPRFAPLAVAAFAAAALVVTVALTAIEKVKALGFSGFRKGG